MIRLWQPLVVNRRGGNGGGGGGGDVVEKNLQYPITADTSVNISAGQGSKIFPFNVDKNKCVLATGGYNGGLKTISLGSSSYTTIHNVNSSVPSQLTVADDDSFFIYYNSGTFAYVPVNSNYTTGTVISVNVTDLGYSTNTRYPFILSPTRFGFYDYNNSKIGIFKLENGALVEDKSIDCSGLALLGRCCGSFAGNLVLLLGNTSGTTATTGIRIIDPDTEATIYEDTRTDKTNSPNDCVQVGNYLFVQNGFNQSPHVTDPIIIYEYSNGQFSKKSMTTSGYTPKAYTVSSVYVYKQSDSMYIVTQRISADKSLTVLFCDIAGGTIETSFCGFSISPELLFVVMLNNEPRLLLWTSAYSSYSYWYYIYYGNYYLTKVPTEIEYNSNGYTLTTLSQA